MADLRKRLAEALSLAATTRGYRLRDERFHLADGVLPVVRAEVADELRRLAADLYRRSDNVPLSRSGSGVDRVGELRDVASVLTERADELDPQGGAR